MRFGSFAGGIGSGVMQGMALAKGIKEYQDAEALKDLQAEEFGKVDNPAAIEASGAYEKTSDGQYKLKDSNFVTTNEAGDKVELPSAPGLREAFKPVTERDAASSYVQRAQGKGLMTPMEAMAMRRQFKQDDLADMQFNKAVKLDKLSNEHLEELQRLQDPAYAAKASVALYNNDYGQFGQGDHKGRKVEAFDRGDGTFAVTDMEDGTRSRVISANDLRRFATNAYLEKVGALDPHVAAQNADRADKREYQGGMLKAHADDLAFRAKDSADNREFQAKEHGLNRQNNITVARINKQMNPLEAQLKSIAIQEHQAKMAESKRQIADDQTYEQLGEAKAQYLASKLPPEDKKAAVQYIEAKQQALGLRGRSGATTKEAQAEKMAEWRQKELSEVNDQIDRMSRSGLGGTRPWFDSDLKYLERKRDRLIEESNKFGNTRYPIGDPGAQKSIADQFAAGQQSQAAAKPTGLREATPSTTIDDDTRGVPVTQRGVFSRLLRQERLGKLNDNEKSQLNEFRTMRQAWLEEFGG